MSCPSKYLLFLVILAVLVLSIQPDTDARDDVLAALSSILGRGQLVLESFPPVALLLNSHVSALLSTFLGLGSHVLSALLLTHHLTSVSTISARDKALGLYQPFDACTMILLGSSFCICLLFVRPVLSHWTLSTSLASLSSLVSLAVSLYTWQHGSASTTHKSLDFWLGGSEMVLVACSMLGANLYDIASLYSALLIFRISTAVSSQSLLSHNQKPVPLRTNGTLSPFNEIWCAASVAFITLRSTLIFVLVPTLVFGVLFPFSEVSAGGNYQLTFLAPAVRRYLSPACNISSGPPPTQLKLPPYTLVPYSPISLYIPRAGFLWTDNLVWQDEYGVFGPQSQTTDPVPTDIEGVGGRVSSQRVFFADPLARRHPWVFELASIPDDLDLRQRDYVQSHLASGEAIYVRSRITGRYLSPVGGGRPSIVDRELGLAQNDGSMAQFQRFEVG